MKAGFFSRLALSNIKKNYRFFIPKILTEIALLAGFYIIHTLAMDDRIAHMYGGDYIPIFMGLGSAIMAFLSVILMLYTNSFVMKQRKREFGVMNVLGMEKKHVRRIILFESLICTVVSVVAGLIAGIILYKACSLAVCRLLDAEIILGLYYINAKTILQSASLFVLVDIVAYAFNCISIVILKPVDMIKSKNQGEKEPRVKWVLLILGIGCTAAGYYISITTTSPLKALYLFFLAVFLVIFGTYFLFVSGSIWVLKALKKNKRYYYQKNHMTAVSGLLYRMKQNAVGLASIAVLSTCVLVLVSTTYTLYAGMQDTLNENYEKHLYINGNMEMEDKGKQNIPTEEMERILYNVSEEMNLPISSIVYQRYLEASFRYNENGIVSESSNIITESEDFSSICNFMFITANDYYNMTSKKIELSDDEILICPISVTGKKLGDKVNLGNKTYKVKNVLSTFPIKITMSSVISSYGIVFPNESAIQELYKYQKELYKEDCSEFSKREAVVFKNKKQIIDRGREFTDRVFAKMEEYAAGYEGATGRVFINADSIWESREAIYGMYGTLLFLGTILGIVFLFATVLIIYYKQISEGYEDRERFQIMEKIGMSEDEVKKTIKSQVVMVFALPLVVAGVHVAFAFPILTRLMKIMLLSNTWLFVGFTVAIYAIFAFVYLVIYKSTSKAYYRIVH